MTRPLVRVAVASAVFLFAELAVVRWTSSELPHLAFFKNLVLIAAFLGGGLGMAAGVLRPRLARFALPLYVTLVAGVLATVRFGWLANVTIGDRDEHYWNLRAAEGVAGYAGFALFFVLLFVVCLLLFGALGAAVGRSLPATGALSGYAANLVGSLVGVIGMALLAVAGQPPAVWFAVLAVGIGWLACERPWCQFAAMVACLVTAIGIQWISPASVWSLYYRITTAEVTMRGDSEPTWVLNIDHAYTLRVFDFRAPEGDEGSVRRFARRHYELPYRLAQPERVLVLGAGAGNDVAAALRAGAREVDAVEIDGTIVAEGRRHHPEHPYDDPRVNVIVDDARSYLVRTDRRYDLIVLGLVDSHALFSRVPGLRLDNFLYTVENLRLIRTRLADGGLLSISFAIPLDRMWLAYKLDQLIETAFERPPLVFAPMYDASFTFLAGPGLDRTGLRSAAESPAFAELRVNREVLAQDADERGGIDIPTDDWPHLYLRHKGVPASHVALFVILGIVTLVAVRVAQPFSGTPDLHFGLLGAGFLLIETKGITDLGLLFGCTWWTVTAVIAAVLVMALLSVAWVGWRQPSDPRIPYALLFAALLVLFVVRPSQLLVLPLATARILGALLVALPVLFSGVVFSMSFRQAVNPARALGSNLLGAVLGGFLEYGSLAWGIRSLTLIALAIYAMSALTLVGRKRDATAGPTL